MMRHQQNQGSVRRHGLLCLLLVVAHLVCVFHLQMPRLGAASPDFAEHAPSCHCKEQNRCINGVCCCSTASALQVVEPEPEPEESCCSAHKTHHPKKPTAPVKPKKSSDSSRSCWFTVGCCGEPVEGVQVEAIQWFVTLSSLPTTTIDPSGYLSLDAILLSPRSLDPLEPPPRLSL